MTRVRHPSNRADRRKLAQKKKQKYGKIKEERSYSGRQRAEETNDTDSGQ